MIKKPNNWEGVQASSDRPKLPLGCYVCKIMGAVVEDNAYGQGQVLSVRFDIAEGDQMGFYYKDYSSNTMPDKKWSGKKNVYLPLDNGSEADERTKSNFKAFLTAVEQSNAGYTWDWNEKSLTNKIVGVVMRNEEWDFQGKHGWKVRPFRFTAAENVRNGTAFCPKDKPLSSDAAEPIAPSAGYTQVDNSDLPF